MTLLRSMIAVLVLAGTAAMAGAAAPDAAGLAPADSKALIELVNLAGLRQDLLDSKFWAALQATQAAKDWRATDQYKKMQEQIDLFLGNLKMDKGEALKAYVGGRTAVVLLESGDPQKPHGIVMTECAPDLAQRFVDATAAAKASTYRGLAVYEVAKDGRVDRMAYAAGMLIVTSAPGGALEKVIDSATGAAPSLAAQDAFKAVVDGLPAGWRARAFAPQVPPYNKPGAVAMVPQAQGLHFEWRIVGDGREDAAANTPVQLAGPRVLPERTVAALVAAVNPDAIWSLVKAKVGQKETGAEDLKNAEMFIRSWFPGQTMEAITAAFGPEAAAAVLMGDAAGGAPGLVVLLRITPSGGPVARSFKDGLASKAMLLAALAAADKEKPGPKISVREETYGKAEILTIEAPETLDKILGDWAKDVALTVALTDQWLIVGTSASGVKAVVDTAAGTGTSLAAALEKDGVKMPAGPATHWGMIEPARGAGLLLDLMEKFGAKADVEKIQKMSNLAEMLKLTRRISWVRVDEPTVVRGAADVQAAQ